MGADKLENKISITQLSLMKHTIGLDKFSKVKKNKYEAYRNYFCQGKLECLDFEDLCNKGLCEKQINSDGTIYYFVTKKGADVMQGYTGISIILEDED